LKEQLAQRDEAIQAKNGALRKVELDHRSSITDLEQRLRDAESKLQTFETQLKEKDAVIQSTAVKEAEIGKLIKRLSTECENLSVELQEKTRLLNQLENKKSPTPADGNAWRRVIGKLQEEGL
jgi:chromosome segregation ATPase